MESPLSTYKSQTNKTVLRRDTFEFINNKYFKYPFEDKESLFETDERIRAKQLKFFLPGRIYTWQYDPEGKDYLSFYDKRPIVLVHSQYVSKSGNLIVQGLNLNFLPELQRVQTMELFYQIFKNDIKQAEASISKNQIGIFKQAWQFLTNWFFVIKIFNMQAKIGYQWAFRNYIIPRMRNPVIIELEDWSYIPYFVPKEFVGKQPAQIWGDYLKTKEALNKLKPDEKRSKKAQKLYTKPGG